jgi:hypothetical protein
MTSFQPLPRGALEWQRVGEVGGPTGLSHFQCSVAGSHDDEASVWVHFTRVSL